MTRAVSATEAQRRTKPNSSPTLTGRLRRAALAGLILILVGPAFGLEQIGWEDLPGRVAGKLVAAEDLRVLDCPDDLDASQPSRIVMQWIENTFYKWNEYDLGDEGYCIVLEKPVEARLSKEEAQVLLSGSLLWMEDVPAGDGEVLAPGDPDFDLPANPQYWTEPGPQAETVIGADDRTRVGDTTAFPWHTICYLVNQYPLGGAFRGTGTVVSPYMVLTNAHNVYDSGEGGYVSSMTIAPAQWQVAEGQQAQRPFGTRNAVEVRTSQQYIDNEATQERFKYDYAAAFFDPPFNQITTYLPLVFDVSPTGVVNVAGYPKDVQNESNSLDQWFDAGPVVSVEPRILRYTADTSGGNSGSPVWLFNEQANPQRRLVAIHAFGDAQSGNNGGPRLVTANQGVIQEWMSWTPQNGDDAYEENDTRATAYHPGFDWERRWLSSISGNGIQADEDWYRIDVDPAYQLLIINCLFLHSEGDIDIDLVDSNGDLIAESRTITDNEFIAKVLPAAGTYYIRVWYGDEGNSYDLWWNDERSLRLDDFDNGLNNWTWFESGAFTAPAHQWNGSALEATEFAGNQIVYGSWESPKDPVQAPHAPPGYVLRARYDMRSSVNGATCPGFRFRALATHVIESSPGVWDPDFSNADFNADFQVYYSTVDMFHVAGREPGTAGRTYTVLYFPKQTGSLVASDFVTFFTFDLLDLDTMDNDAGILYLDQVTIDNFPWPGTGTGAPVPSLSTSDFSAWTTLEKPIGAPFNDAGLNVAAGPGEIRIDVAPANQWFEAAAVSPAVSLQPGQYYRATFTVTATPGDPAHAEPTVRAGFASAKFVFSADKNLPGGSTQASFGASPESFEVWMTGPTADPAMGGGLTEPMSLRFESWQATNPNSWPFFKTVSGTVRCTGVVTESFSPF